VTDFVQLLGLPPDGAITTELLYEAAARLLETGFFARIEVRCTPNDTGRLHVDVKAEPALLVRSMQVRTSSALASELRRRVFLRAGSVWTDDNELVQRQLGALREYFEQRGYFGSDVRLVIERDLERALVELDFVIERGARRSVNNIYVRGTEVFDYEEVRSILLGEFDLLRTFTTRRFDRAQRELVSRYRAAGYIQARVVLDEARQLEGGLVDLFVEVREGPRWQIRIEGARVFSESELLRRLTFYRTGLVDDAELALSAREIAALYETRGHYFATVDIRAETAEGGDRLLTVRIDEGPASALRTVTLLGADQVDNNELRAALGSQVYEVLSPGGYLQRSVLDSDLRTLISTYRSRGFLRAVPTRTLVQRGSNPDDLHLTIQIDEGEQTHVGSVDLDVIGEIPVRLRDLRVRADQPFVPTDLEADRATLLQAASRAGFAAAIVEVECTDDGGTPVPCSGGEILSTCRLSPDGDREAACARGLRGGLATEECVLLLADPGCMAPSPLPTMNIRWRVEPGPSAVFGSVLLRGNFRTVRSVLRREFRMRQGDPFDIDRVLRAQSDLRSLGIFDAVRVNTIWHPDPATGGDAATLLVAVEEARAQSVEHRVGLEARIASADDALLILSNEPTYRNINFLGRAEELRISGNLDLDVIDAARVRDAELRGGVSVVLFDPRFWLWGTLNDAWEARNELAWSYDLLAPAPAPLRKSLEFSTRVREEFRSVRGLSFEVGLSIRRTRTADQSIASLERVFETAIILSLSPRVTLERRDSPLNPTRGTFSQVEFEVADDLFGVLSSRRFSRVTTRFSGFVPIGRGLVFGGAARVGLATGGLTDALRTSGGLALPLSERFTLGGVTSLRGFAEGAVTPDSSDEFGGDVVVNGSFELRYPFLTSLGIDGAVFVDWGQLARDVPDLRPDAFRYSTGLGVRWLIADLVPFVIDYGAVLGRRPGERPGRLHFNIGYTF
jgi:outer membrane protein insertion porin family